MSDQRDGGISWTEQTWNPIRGCSRISEGCRNCYAETMAARFAGPGQPYEGLAKSTPSGPRWTGKVMLVEDHLADPLRWTRPRLVFVNSMSDLFHEALTNEQIAAVFGVMAAAPRHTFQVLTKRAKRMREWFAWAAAHTHGDGYAGPLGALMFALECAPARLGPLDDEDGEKIAKALEDRAWPLPNVWLGVSVEDQASADERIPELLRCPAAVRWVSYEPAIGPVDFDPPHCQYHGRRESFSVGEDGATLFCDGCAGEGGEAEHSAWLDPMGDDGKPLNGGINWIVVGGESGPGARPFNVAWARETIYACKAAEVACFVKQMGTDVRANGLNLQRWGDGVCVDTTFDPPRLTLRDKKGGDPSEWPEGLRVREWPATTGAKTEARG